MSKSKDLKEFELVFKKDIKGNLKYSNFNRLTDRPISQQKVEIKELLSLGFEEALVNIAIEKGIDLSEIDDNEEMVFGFKTDKDYIHELKIGFYNFDKIDK